MKFNEILHVYVILQKKKFYQKIIQKLDPGPFAFAKN